MYGRVLKRTDRKRQEGMTMLGLVILLAFVGIFAFAFLRLTPVYLNYLKVVGVVDGVHEEFDGNSPTAAAIRRSVRRRFDIESVSEIEAQNVKLEAVDGGYKVSAIYEHTAPFIANVYFTVKFDKSVIVRR